MKVTHSWEIVLSFLGRVDDFYYFCAVGGVET